MKRRTFIRVVGASALAMPFAWQTFGPKLANGRPGPSVKKTKEPLSLRLTPEESGVAKILGKHASGVYLAGGCVLAKAAGGAAPCINFLVASKAMARIKSDLFALGVTPVSTPGLPSILIRFSYAGKSYSVLNMELEPFLQQNVLGRTLGLVPFAHNFPVWAVDAGWVIDPYGALQSRNARGDRYQMKLLQQPKTALIGFEYCLAGAFDRALLELEPSPEFTQMEDRILDSTVATQTEARTVIEYVLNYFPDLLELQGLDYLRRYLLSPLCLGSATAAAGIDLRRVDSILRGIRKRGDEVTGARFFRALDFEFRQKKEVREPGRGLADYMVAHRCVVRRPYLLVDAVEQAFRS